jgi:hypothetical protein
MRGTPHRLCDMVRLASPFPELAASIDQELRMTIADMVYKQVKLLPDPLAREVLDFVGFLREGRDRAEWRDLMNAQTSGLAAVWDNPEDKVWDDV